MWFLLFLLILAVLAFALLAVTRNHSRVHGDPDLGRPRNRRRRGPG
jgi:hypothetical protein